MTNYEIWQAVLAEFELKVSKANFSTWFKNTGISTFDERGEVLICVPNTFIKSWLEKKYHTDIIKLLEKITSHRVKKVIYKVENIKNIEEAECSISPQPTVSTTTTPMYSKDKKELASQFGINPKYSFDTFVVGKGNELAHAAAKAVGDRPGEAYNPLFIYGGVGLGKTHLIQAIAQTMLEKNQQTKILYVSSEKFTSDFVNAVKEGRAKEFKTRYRSVDLLLIDDIQFISGKEQTQEEFFHTFNELHQNGKQIVMTSDRPPKAIPALEDRLRSRFEWGMIADVGAPDLETRVAILQKKCQEKNVSLEDDILQLIATLVQSNIRELEGALNKVAAYHELKNMEPTKDSVQEILASFEQKSMKRSITPREVVQTIAGFFDVSIEDLLGKSRKKNISFPRQIAMYLMREELNMSYPSIGEEIGGRDHTTAMHAHNKVKREQEEDLTVQQNIGRIKQRLYADSV